MKPWLNILFALLLISRSGHAQGFLNLNFEQATVASAPSGYTPADAFNSISTASAFPFWTVREDSNICYVVWGAPLALD
jgi:hypothetical protein